MPNSSMQHDEMTLQTDTNHTWVSLGAHVSPRGFFKKLQPEPTARKIAKQKDMKSPLCGKGNPISPT